MNSHQFNDLPLISSIRNLREITQGSKNCGWIYDEIAFLIYSIVKWYKPDIAIQTGHLWGKSALSIIQGINDGFLYDFGIEVEDQNADKTFSSFVSSNTPKNKSKPVIISVDPEPLNVPNYQEGIQYISKNHDNFIFYKMKSQEFFRNIGNHIKKIDEMNILGFVDGDHSLLGCLKDLESFNKLGAKLIIIDDTKWIPYIGQITKEFAKRNKYNYIDLPYYNGLGILISKSFKYPKSPHPNNYKNKISIYLYKIGGIKLVKIYYNILNHKYTKSFKLIFKKLHTILRRALHLR